MTRSLIGAHIRRFPGFVTEGMFFLLSFSVFSLTGDNKHTVSIDTSKSLKHI